MLIINHAEVQASLWLRLIYFKTNHSLYPINILYLNQYTIILKKIVASINVWLCSFGKIWMHKQLKNKSLIVSH